MDWRGTNPFIPSRSLPRSPPRSRLWKDQDANSDVEVEDKDDEGVGSVISPEPSTPVENYGVRVKAPGIDFSDLKDSTFTSDDGAEERKDDFVDFRDLRVFEKMEQLTERPSFCSQGSAVDRFMSHNLSFDEARSEDEEEFSEKEDSVSSECSFEESDDEKENKQVFDKIQDETVDRNVVIDKNCDREEKLEEVEYDAVLRDMYAAVRQNPPHERDESSILCSTVLERLNQQDTVMKDMKQELQLAKELRKALECKEKELQSERLKFESYKLEENAKLEKQEKRIMMRSKSVEKVNDEITKLRDLNSQQLAKINTLNKKILRIETELRRKSNLWDSDKKKLLERIEVLEKLNKELQKSQFQGCPEDHSTNETSTSSTRLSQKRIQFSVDSSGSSTSGAKTTGNPASSVKTTNQKPRKSVIPAKSAMKKSSLKNQMDQKLMESSNVANPICEKPSDTSDAISFYDTAIIEQMQTEQGIEGMPISTNLELENSPKSNVRNSKSCVIVNNLGDTETVYTNGCRKYVSKSRNFSRVIYQNGDIKEKRPDGSILYFYSELGIRQYHYPNGLEMTSYPNGQMERKNPDGTHEILFPNGCVKFYRMDGREEFIFPDNTVYQLDTSNGNAVLCLPNGQKEIHSSNWKKRIYPDGTTKTVFGDGTLETEYPNGRIRRKDSSGNLVFDLLSSTPTLQSETQDAGKQLIQQHANK